MIEWCTLVLSTRMGYFVFFQCFGTVIVDVNLDCVGMLPDCAPRWAMCLEAVLRRILRCKEMGMAYCWTCCVEMRANRGMSSLDAFLKRLGKIPSVLHSITSISKTTLRVCTLATHHNKGKWKKL